MVVADLFLVSAVRRRPSSKGFLLAAAFLTVCSILSAGASASDGENIPTAQSSANAGASESDRRTSARLYLTNQERREIGQPYALRPWLSATALVEAEGAARLQSRRRGASDRMQDTSLSAQIGFSAAMSPNIGAQLVLDHDIKSGGTRVDEAIMSMETGQWEFEIGRAYTPLGVYMSNFATGPLLEFAESRVDGATLSYAPNDQVDFKVVGYHGTVPSNNPSRSRMGWAASIDARLGGQWQLGIGYQSDLADAQDAPLRSDEGGTDRRVDAASAYAQWTRGNIDLSFEIVSALKSSRVLAPDRDKPVAWSIELAHFSHPELSWAIRWEGSRELADAPHRRAGIALSWRPSRQASLTVEYLHGRFVRGLATDDDDSSYTRERQLGTKLSYAF